MATRVRRGGFTVSGAGETREGYEAGGIALSAALTFAARAVGETTVYVRDALDKVVGRVERDEAGVMYVYGSTATRP